MKKPLASVLAFLIATSPAFAAQPLQHHHAKPLLTAVSSDFGTGPAVVPSHRRKLTIPTPVNLSALINANSVFLSGVPWTNGRGLVTGATLQSAYNNLQQIHTMAQQIFAGMGTWDQYGNYSPSGSGAALTGITAAQVGALAPNGSGANLTGLTAAQISGLFGGTFPTASSSGFYYGPFSGPSLVVGTQSAPVGTAAPIAITKYVNTDAAVGGESPAFYSNCQRVAGTAANGSCQGAMFEAVDFIGDTTGNFSFIEGMKSVGVKNTTANDGGGVYGAVNWSQAPFADYWIGNESQIVRNSGNNANGAPPTNYFNKTHFSANYLASNGIGGSDTGDVAFLINPNNTALTQTGFMCPGGVVGQTCFADFGTQNWGMDLSLGVNPHGYGAIGLSNNDPIRIRKSCATPATCPYANALYLSTNNQVVVAYDTSLLVPSFIQTSYIKLVPATFATITSQQPCNSGNAGNLAVVSDGTSQTPGATAAGGGSLNATIKCNAAGTAYIVVGG